MSSSYPRSTIYRWLLLTLVGVLGILSGVAAAMPPLPASPHLLTLRPAPATLAELVARSRAIVIGTVGPLVQEGTFAGYAPQGNLLVAAEHGLPPEAEVAYFDYELHIEQVVKDDGTVRVGQPVIVRLFSKAVPGMPIHNLEFPPSVPGDRHLFFLDRNPDQRTYGIWFGPASRLIIDGPIVRQSDGAQTPVRYSGEMTPAALLRSIREIIDRPRTP